MGGIRAGGDDERTQSRLRDFPVNQHSDLILSHGPAFADSSFLESDDSQLKLSMKCFMMGKGWDPR